MMFLQLNRCFQQGKRANTNPTSPRQGYDLKVAIRDNKLVANNMESLRKRIDSGIKYSKVTLIWNE